MVKSSVETQMNIWCQGPDADFFRGATRYNLIARSHHLGFVQTNGIQVKSVPTVTDGEAIFIHLRSARTDRFVAEVPPLGDLCLASRRLRVRPARAGLPNGNGRRLARRPRQDHGGFQAVKHLQSTRADVMQLAARSSRTTFSYAELASLPDPDPPTSRRFLASPWS
jgi:hypothetical protein